MKLFKSIGPLLAVLAVVVIFNLTQLESSLLADVDIDIFSEVGDQQGFVDPSSVAGGDHEHWTNDLQDIVYYLIDLIKWVLYAIALIFVVLAGFRMVISQGNEDVITTSRHTIAYSILGFVIIFLADVAVTEVFFGSPEAWDIELGECLLHPEICATKGKSELLWVVYWWKNLAAILAFVAIVVSGIRMILATGSEDTISSQRRVILFVVIGLVILALNEIIVEEILYVTKDSGVPDVNERLKVNPRLENGVKEVVGIIQFILQFLGVLAFGAIVYGGFLMVANFGDDDRVGKGKTIIVDAIIGIIIAFSAYAIVSTIA